MAGLRAGKPGVKAVLTGPAQELVNSSYYSSLAYTDFDGIKMYVHMYELNLQAPLTSRRIISSMSKWIRSKMIRSNRLPTVNSNKPGEGQLLMKNMNT